ncbi:MAG: hypothetical protein GWP60_04070, partial [Gammaproteobacteria bacterium]|nr:hypothetical protein [Gammaproteobacteria bacterium]
MGPHFDFWRWGESAADDAPCVSVIDDTTSRQVHFPTQRLKAVIVPDRSKLGIDCRVNEDCFALRMCLFQVLDSPAWFIGMNTHAGMFDVA